MTRETFGSVKKALETTSVYGIFQEAIGTPEDLSTEGNNTFYAIMFNVETDKLFFLEYATSDNSWAKTAEQQNPWICIGYVSAEEILTGDPAGTIETELLYEVEQQEQMEKERRLYNS